MSCVVGGVRRAKYYMTRVRISFINTFYVGRARHLWLTSLCDRVIAREQNLFSILQVVTSSLVNKKKNERKEV